MKLQAKYKVGGLLLLVTVFCIRMVVNAYVVQKELEVAKVAGLFTQSLQIEMDKYKLSNVYLHYDSTKSDSPDISLEEKKAWLHQWSLSNRDPNRVSLDSIFNAELVRQGIKGEGAIYFMRDGKTICTAADSLFKENALMVKRMNYRLNHKPGSEMFLEGYVKFSFWGLFFQIPSILMYLIGWSLLIVGIYGGYKYWQKEQQQREVKERQQKFEDDLRRKKEEEEGKKREEEKKRLEEKIRRLEEENKRKQDFSTVIEKEKPLESSIFIEWIKLPNGIRFDKTHGKVKYSGGIIDLTDMNRTVFAAFIESENNLLSYMRIRMLFLKVKHEKISREERAAISATIIRLRKQLEAISSIEILSIRGIGYQLVIKKENEDKVSL